MGRWLTAIKHLGILVLLLLGLGGVALAQEAPSGEFSPQVGDTFTLEAITRLRGQSREYRGYTERERDRRTYQITAIDQGVITWEVTSRFRYSDSDGGSLQDDRVFTVKTDAQTRAYLEGTYDGRPIDQDYYRFDRAWFYVDPTTLMPGDRLTILGHLFTVTGPNTLRLHPWQVVDSRQVILNQAYTQKIVNDEYDPTGEWMLTVQGTRYHYDPHTGYILGADWQAEGTTTVGRFRWSETIRLRSSSFPLATNRAATLEALLPYGLAGGLGIAFAIGFIPFQRRLWRQDVEQVLRFAPRKTRSKAIAWNPVQLPYGDLLQGDAVGQDYLQLRPGIYVVSDRQNRLAIVDTHANQYLPTEILPTELDRLRLVYGLALGRLTVQAAPALNELSPYTIPATGFAPPDHHSLEHYRDTTFAPPTPNLEATMTLLARRRVLDYTLGQAPLSPTCHQQKVNKILAANPRAVLLVGDDDLIAISLAREGIEVTVLEIDPYTCALIEGIARTEHLPITLFQHDLRRALPAPLGDRFDLFVSDSDFTLTSCFLFITRGLSCLQMGGIGLINFENRRAQRFKAQYLLEKLQVKILEIDQEKWHYTILRNQKVEESRVHYGKHVQINYRDDIRLAQANYTSCLFQIQRQPETKILLPRHQDFPGDQRAIYDE